MKPKKTFLIDEQTFVDLEIFEGKNSIFRFFNKAISYGGKDKLLEMFNAPLSTKKDIVERQEFIDYICKEKLPITINRHLLDFIETYLLIYDKPTRVSRFNAWHKYLKYKLKPTNEYFVIQRGIKYVIDFLQELYACATDNSTPERPYLLEQQLKYIAESLENTELRKIIGFDAGKKLNAMNRETFDYIFRYCELDKLKTILETVYQIDAFRAVAETMIKYELVFPEISPNKDIEITGLYHLFLKEAVKNDVCITPDSNVFFITGGNMAGKSTFLKAFGIAVYMAHLGFPAPVASMRVGVFNGLFSTINIADNLNKGYSHFYSEVIRVKAVAENINKTDNLVVIFDELFRGTNVKDAHDATLSIISAFAKVRGSVFLVSSHIMEVADKLQANVANIRFGYFHTAIDGKTPVYSYRLREGTTEERLGMLIIENERIIETIEAQYLKKQEE